MNKLSSIFSLFLAILISSCNVNVNLAKRYKNSKEQFLWVSDADVKKYVSLDFNSTYISSNVPTVEVKTANTKSFFDLSPEAQVELIKYSITKAANYDQVITDLKKLLDPDKPTTSTPSSSVKFISPVIKKSLQFAVQKAWYSANYTLDGSNKIIKETRYFTLQGERINYLDITFGTESNNIEFNSWDKYVTNWATIDLGKVSAAQTWNATLNLTNSATLTSTGTNTELLENTTSNSSSLTNAEKTTQSQTGDATKGANTAVLGSGATLTTGGNAGISYNDKFETSQNLSNRILAFSGLLKPKSLAITQESGAGIDLSGTYNVGVEIIFTGDFAKLIFNRFEKLYSNRSAVPEATLTLTSSTVFYPDVTENIIAHIRYKYLYRKITAGSAHLPEARQKVTYYYGELGYPKVEEKYDAEYYKSQKNKGIPATEVVLIKKDEFKPITFRIMNASGNVLNFDNTPLQFETLDDATKCMQYLIDILGSGTSSSRFTVNASPLTSNMLPGLKISRS